MTAEILVVTLSYRIQVFLDPPCERPRPPRSSISIIHDASVKCCPVYATMLLCGDFSHEY